MTAYNPAISEEFDPIIDAVSMASHQTRHRGDIHFAFKQEFDGEKPLFLPSGLLSTVSFADPCCLVFEIQFASFSCHVKSIQRNVFFS